LRVRVGFGVSRRALAALVELARPHGPDGPDVVPGPDPLWDLDVLRVRTRACAHGKGGTGGTRGRRRRRLRGAGCAGASLDGAIPFWACRMVLAESHVRQGPILSPSHATRRGVLSGLSRQGGVSENADGRKRHEPATESEDAVPGRVRSPGGPHPATLGPDQRGV